MEQNPYWEANRFSASQEIPHILWFITSFTRSLPLYIFWARSIQPMPSIPLLKIHLNITLPSTPGSSKWFFPSGFPTRTLYAPLSPYLLHDQPISYWFVYPNNIWWGVQIINLLIMLFYALPCYLVPLRLHTIIRGMTIKFANSMR